MQRLLLCAALAVVASGLGCITTAGGNLADVDVARPASAPAIEQTIGDFSFHLDGGKMVTSTKMGRELNNEILGRWVESGFIESHKYVKHSRFSADVPYRLTLEGHQEGESSLLLQVLSGLTILVFPHYVDTQMSLTYVLEDAAMGCRFSASIDESYNTIISLLLLPVSPFMQTGSGRTFDRIADNLYLRLEQQGAFGASTPCSDLTVQGS